MKDVIGFGALNVDLIYPDDSSIRKAMKKCRIKPGSEVMVNSNEHKEVLDILNSRKHKRKRGGSAANVVYSLARMGFRTGYIGKVGPAEYGGFLKKALSTVDKKGIKTGREASGKCYIIIDKKAERTILVDPGVNDTLRWEDVDLDYANNTKILHMTSFAGDMPLQAQLFLIENLDRKIKLSFDPGQLYANKGMDLMKRFFERADFSFPSEEEVRTLTNKDYRNGSKFLKEMNPNSVLVCKRGKRGCYILAEREIYIQAKKVKAVDTTGAGDVFVAGFLAGFLKKLPSKECGELGVEAAAAKVMSDGKEGYPGKEFLREFQVDLENEKI